MFEQIPLTEFWVFSTYPELTRDNTSCHYPPSVQVISSLLLSDSGVFVPLFVYLVVIAIFGFTTRVE